jgi:hypothetical protein
MGTELCSLHGTDRKDYDLMSSFSDSQKISSLFCISAREHGPARGSLEGVQPDGGGPGARQGQLLHQEQGGLCAPAPLLPERAQRDVPGHPAGRLQTRHQK